jgi:hypothetical protein
VTLKIRFALAKAVIRDETSLRSAWMISMPREERCSAVGEEGLRVRPRTR